MKPAMLVSALGLGLVGMGAASRTVHFGTVAPALADSVVLTISASSDAQQPGTLHTFTLHDAVNPSQNPTLRSTSLVTRADTIITTLPAQVLLGKQPSEITISAQDRTAIFRFDLELIEVGRDSLLRCVEQGRMYEVGRLPEGGVVFRVDGARPPRCERQARR